MSFETSINYAVYNLCPGYYVKQPDGLRECPVCGGTLSKSNISPSKAVSTYLASATIGYNSFSNLYECPTCHWWAVWECFGDAEGSQHFSILITSLSDDNQVSLEKAWSQILENENAYNHHMPLPKSVEQVLIGGQKRIIEIPIPGQRVRLIGNVHVLRDGELEPLFIGGSEGVAVSDEELYASIENQHLNPESARNHVIRLKSIIEATNCYPIRLKKLVVSDDRWHPDSCKEGEIYLIDAADIKKMD